MGAGQTKEEQLYQAVQNSNYQAVKTLHRDGALLEWVDKEGRTPLILACTRGDLYDMALTLLNLGANINAYRPGNYGGYPLHHAAKRGLEKTVLLLLSSGADPLAINDDGLTPLDMARSRGYVSVVRIIEDRICLFSGIIRELSGPGFLEALAPQWVTKRIWVVVLPTESGSRRLQRNELVIYQSPKVPIPRTVISLAKAEVEEPKFNLADPVLVITATDKTAKIKFKLLSENEGDKAQLERLYRACRGFVQSEVATSTLQGTSSQATVQGLQALVRPSGPPEPGPSNVPATTPCPIPTTPKLALGKQVASTVNPIPEDVALAMAIDASIRTASAEGIIVSPSAHPSSSSDPYQGWDSTAKISHNGWGPVDQKRRKDKSEIKSDTLGSDSAQLSASVTPGSPDPSAASSRPPIAGLHPNAIAASSTSPPISVASPSAPPLPSEYGAVDGPIHYPSIDTSPVQLNYMAAVALANAPSSDSKGDEKGGGGQCVVCWDAPAQGVCIPCGHLAGCMDCLTEIKSKEWGCPVCRSSIQQVVKVYAV